MRRFVAVPEGATWAELRLRAGPQDTHRVCPPPPPPPPATPQHADEIWKPRTPHFPLQLLPRFQDVATVR